MTSQTNRKAVAAALIAVALAVALLGLAASYLVVGLEACGGDGGSPYAAPDSPQGLLCDDLEGLVGYLVFLVAPILLVAAAIWVIVRWRKGTASIALAVGALLAAPGWSLAAVAVASSPPDVCAPGQERAYDAWRDAAREYGIAHSYSTPYPIDSPNDCY